MRVLVADHDSTLLEATARGLRADFPLDVVTSKANCLDLLRQNEFQVLVAGERLVDGSGLDLLSQASKRWPSTLRIFAADPSRLGLLAGRLGPFKLFQNVTYPIDPVQLRSILLLAQAAQAADADTANVQHIILGADRVEESSVAVATPSRSRTAIRPVADTRAASARAGRADTAPAAGIPAQELVLVLSRDKRCLDAVSEALGARASGLTPMSDASSVFRALAVRSVAAVFADLGSLDGHATAFFEQARAVAPRTLLIAAGRKHDAPSLKSLIAAGVLHRFLVKPLDRAETREAFASLRDGTACVPQAVPAPASAAQPVQELAVAARLAAELRPALEPLPDGPRPVHWILGAAAVLAFGLITLFARRDPADSSSPVTAQPAAPVPAPSPDTHELVTALEAALTADDFAGARAAAAKLRAADPDHPRLAFLEALIERGEQSERAARQTRGTGSRTRPLPSAGAAGTGSPSSIALEPRAPSTAPVATAASDEAAPPTASLAPVGRAETTRPMPGPVERPASFSGRTLEESALAPTAPAPAPRQRYGSERFNPEDLPPVVREHRLIRRVAPDYPGEAARAGVEGAVELAFTIAANGRVRDVAVLSADPPGVFDREAIAAVRRWRFEPRIEDGVAVDWRTRTRVEFRLDR